MPFPGIFSLYFFMRSSRFDIHSLAFLSCQEIFCGHVLSGHQGKEKRFTLLFLMNATPKGITGHMTVPSHVKTYNDALPLNG